MSVKYNKYFLKDGNRLFTTCKSAPAHFPFGQSETFQYPPHWREYEDCKQILKLSLKPTHKQTPGKTSASKPSEDLPYGQSGIRRLSARIRCAPAFCQSSSIHNSLRSIKQKRSGDLDASLPYTMISCKKSLSLQKIKIS